MRSRLSRRWIWIVLVVVIAALVLPMFIAERYTSTTQDGQYMGHPWRSIRFLLAAILVSPSSDLSTSGKALARAKDVFSGTERHAHPGRTPLLPVSRSLHVQHEVRPATDRGPPAQVRVGGVGHGCERHRRNRRTDVVALLDYGTGQVLDSVVPPR